MCSLVSANCHTAPQLQLHLVVLEACIWFGLFLRGVQATVAHTCVHRVLCRHGRQERLSRGKA